MSIPQYLDAAFLQIVALVVGVLSGLVIGWFARSLWDSISSDGETDSETDEHSPEHLHAVTAWLQEINPSWDVEMKRQFYKWRLARSEWELYLFNQQNPPIKK